MRQRLTLFRDRIAHHPAAAYLTDPRVITALFAIAAIAAGVGEILKGPKDYLGVDYPRYNNFLIFKHSFYNLLAGKDLYIAHPDLFFDFYKYSPGFALLMGPLAILPDVPGLLLWNLLNAVPLVLAIWLIPHLDRRQRIIIAWLVLLELFTSLQNSQSNGLLAGLFLLAFVAFERERPVWAALALTTTVFVKLFGLAFFPLMLLYPGKRRFFLAAAGFAALFTLAPLLVVSPGHLLELHRSWVALLGSDQSVSYGISVMGILESWSGWTPPQLLLIGIGAAVTYAPLLRLTNYGRPVFRRLFFAALLIWVVIFNHKAESPTFVIAMCGIALWYVSGTAGWWRRGALIGAFLLVSLSPTDLFPGRLRNGLVRPFKLKALPAVAIWIWGQVEMWRLDRRGGTRSAVANGRQAGANP